MQIYLRWVRMSCPPAGTDSNVVLAVCVARGSRVAVFLSAQSTLYAARAARGTAHGAVYGARGQNLNCVDVA